MSRFGVAVAAILVAVATGAAHAQPSFDCAQAVGTIQELICKHSELAALDRKLGEIYRQAHAKSTADARRRLEDDQANWIRGRNGCARYGDDPRGCLGRVYRHRTTELQARYQLVPLISRTAWICDGNPADEVVASIYDSDPRTAIIERGGRGVAAWQESSGAGERFEGGAFALSINGNDATITWMGTDMRCVARK